MQHTAPISTTGVIAGLDKILKTKECAEYIVDQNPRNFRKVVKLLRVVPTQLMKTAIGKTKYTYKEHMQPLYWLMH